VHGVKEEEEGGDEGGRFREEGLLAGGGVERFGGFDLEDGTVKSETGEEVVEEGGEVVEIRVETEQGDV